ncbi:MAG TPA: glycerol acyltransferase, partial [Saprospiraceae bacterium]|nr:glycerol acyltransferase [Saprospiraceae bacterium]
MAIKTKTYPPLIPDMKDWPIYKLSEDRDKFIEEIIELTMDRLMRQPKLSDTIAKTIYLERIRIKEGRWKVDPPNEQLFWKKIRKKLITKSLDKEEKEARIQNKEILYKIVKRYANEIVGTFKPKTFQFARKFLTMFFSRLLNTAAGRNFQRIYSSRHRLYERFKVRGYVEEIRSLMKIGTVILVPTHSSNLDSILVGYVMDAVLGLPSFSYGAGLNLYNTGYTAYFMNRMGAYRIDRRKKNPIYLETLKT